MRSSLAILVSASFILLLGCNKTAVPVAQPESVAQSTVASVKIDPCALLPREQVAGVQSTEITDTKSSETVDGVLLNSQCYYSARESSKSVSFTLTQSGSKNAGGDEVTQQWEQTFGRFKHGREGAEAGAKEGTEKGREENEKELAPQKIEGLGDEAYWSGNRFGGALYVLRKQYILRISVGGPGDPPAKLARSKELAVKALSSL